MIELLDKHCEEANNKEKDEEFLISAYDFLYLPVDFRLVFYDVVSIFFFLIKIIISIYISIFLLR